LTLQLYNISYQLRCLFEYKPWPVKYVGPFIAGGVKPEEFDYFHEMIIHDEVSRAGSGGLVWGQVETSSNWSCMLKAAMTTDGLILMMINDIVDLL